MRFAFFLGVNVAFFAWIIMIAIGATWHIFGVLSPIGFLASLPLGLVATLLAFAVFARRSREVDPASGDGVQR